MFEDIDSTIESVEKLYRAVSGREANGAEAAPLPPEKDATKHVEDQLDRLLGALAAVPAGGRQTPAWVPPVTFVEQEQGVLICVDLPGVQREHLTVTVTPLAIAISGRRPMPPGVVRAEVPTGSFHREIPVPPGIFVNDLTATFRDGVLELRIPRAGRPAPRPITIQ